MTSQYLKGNYELPVGGKGKTRRKKGIRQEFEERALEKLGGSIAFVMKPGTFVWEGDDPETAGRETT